MKIIIAVEKTPSHSVSAALLGQQIEACYGSVEGMLSDRLTNPKFTAPADPRTGIAHKWRPTFTTMPGVHCALTSNLSLSGNESQMIHCYWPETELGGIQQNNVQLKAGEVLEMELWAKAMSEPVNIRTGLKPLSALAPVYDQADISINASYWKRYSVKFRVPRNDNEAIFFIRLCGEGKLWIDQVHLRPVGENLLCADMVRSFESLKIPVMRFPGGTESNNYHWRHGIGPTHLRPALSDPVFKSTIQYDFGTDEYLALCNEQGITPHITVNMGTGTPEEAAQWAEYCAQWFQQRHIEPPVIYFEMGNEQGGHHELGHMTPEMYVSALYDFVPSIRHAYPKARIIAIGREHYYYLRSDQLKQWRKTVLANAADIVDVFATHLHQGFWGETAEQQQINIIRSVNSYRKNLEEMIQDIRMAGHKHPVAVTEWTNLIHAGQSDGKGFFEPYDVMHCQYVACVLHELARLGKDVELANFYQLINVSGIFMHKKSIEVEETQMAEVFKLYRPAFPGKVLILRNNSPALALQGELANASTTASVDSVPNKSLAEEVKAPMVDALSILSGNDTWLFLINLHPSQGTKISLQGFSMQPSDAVLLTGDKPTGKFRRSLPVVSANELDMPPLSLLRIRYTDNVI